MTQATDDILASLAHYMKGLEQRVSSAELALTETYEHWRDARNAELLLVRNDLEEARRTNRKLLEEYYTLSGRLSQSEGEAAALLAQLEETRGGLARVRDAADQAISNLRAIKSLNDDPTIEQIVDETADALGEVLHAD